MTLPVDHIHNLDSYITNEGEAFESVAGTDNVQMDLWVPSERVTAHFVDIPSAPRRKWPELIPWMLEDRLLQAVEEMHFVITEATSESQLQVLAISHDDLKNWQRVAQNAGVSAQSMLPDYLALPWESERISVGWRDGVCLVRYGLAQGFAASPDIAWAMVDNLLSQQEVPARLSISIPQIDWVPEHLREQADINNAGIEWQFAELPKQFNLLTGNFKPAANSALGWLPAAALGILLLVLSVAYMQIGSGKMESQITDLENQLVQNYARLFDGRRPQAQRVRTEAERRIDQLFMQRQSLNADPMAALIALNSLMVNCDCQLIMLSSEDGTLTLHVDNAARLKERTLNIPGYQIALRQREGSDENAIELRLNSRRGSD
jgi:type II secretion system protein L